MRNGCSAAAVRAYKAAEANPALHAPRYTNGTFGGGDYPMTMFPTSSTGPPSELYLTPVTLVWLKRAKASPHWSGPVFYPDGFNWRSTGCAGAAPACLGALKHCPRSDLRKIRSSVQGSGSLSQGAAQGGVRLDVQPRSGFGWGSNQSVIQNMIVVATAYDITGKKRYLQAVRESMDYMLGRNAWGFPMSPATARSMPSGSIPTCLRMPLDPSYPKPPKGVLAGGPNSQPADDYAIKTLEGCAPQACYVDDPRSFSTNEIAINWNAPLVWIASFLADAP
jgi:endoglucanase